MPLKLLEGLTHNRDCTITTGLSRKVYLVNNLVNKETRMLQKTLKPYIFFAVRCINEPLMSLDDSVTGIKYIVMERV